METRKLNFAVCGAICCDACGLRWRNFGLFKFLRFKLGVRRNALRRAPVFR